MIRITKMGLTLGLLFTTAQFSLAQAPAVVREPTGGFTYTAPKGWAVRTFPGLKYHVAATNPVDGFAPNINVVDENYAGSLADYAKLNLKTAPKMFSDFKLISQSNFKTASGLSGIRLVANLTPSSKPIKVHEIFYLLSGKGNRKYTVTFGAAASQNGKLDPLGDGAIQTFKLL